MFGNDLQTVPWTQRARACFDVLLGFVKKTTSGVVHGAQAHHSASPLGFLRAEERGRRVHGVHHAAQLDREVQRAGQNPRRDLAEHDATRRDLRFLSGANVDFR